jgi:hypothetical protein
MTQDTLSYATGATTSPFLPRLLTTSGSAALRIKNSELPAAIQVDETANHEVARRIAQASRSMTAIRPKAPSRSASHRPTYTTLTPSPSEASTSSVLSPEPHNGRTLTAAGWSLAWLRG